MPRRTGQEENIDIQEVCGTGSFGEVHRGLWAGTEVAVKRLHRQDWSTELLDEMRQEISVLQRLHHPNVVSSIASRFCGSREVAEIPIGTA